MKRRSPWLAFGLAVVIVGVVLLLDRFAPSPPERPAATELSATTVDPVAGSWVCTAGDGRDGTALDAFVARPSGIGSGPATVELVGVHEGLMGATSLPTLFPPSHATERIEAEAENVATWARWSGAPATVSREWRWDGAEDLPAATVAGPCAQPFSSEWVVPGMSTAGGHEARLQLANPFRTDATVAVYFITPEGIRAPIALQNWTVPAQSVREINVNEVLPEEDDLAAVVNVATGRLSVEGYQITRAAIGGVDGGSLLAAAPAPAEEWTVPWVADHADASSWLWIVNTGDRTAPVELTLHTADGGSVPEGLGEVSVPPGELRRVDLSETLPGDAEDAAVTARSDGAPVVVSSATLITSPEQDDEDVDELAELDDPDEEEEPTVAPDTGFAVQLGSSVLDATWSISGGTTSGRDEQLRLVNPSGDPATVDVALFDGSRVVEPEDLQSIAVGAGSAVAVSVTDHLEDAPAWTAFVTASEGEIVAGRVGQGGDVGLHLIAVPGVPAAAAQPAGELLAGVETDGLVQRMGTALGLDDADPFDVPSQPAPAEPELPDDAQLDQLFDPDDEGADPDGEDADLDDGTGLDADAEEPDDEADPDDDGDVEADDPDELDEAGEADTEDARAGPD